MKNILLVDDEEDFQRILKRVIEPAGYRTVSALSAEEALRMAEAFTPALVIVDWNLPGISGLELIKKFRNLPKYSKVPIIMYTVRDLEEEQISAYLADVQAYLNKPVNPAVLVAKIKQLLKDE